MKSKKLIRIIAGIIAAALFILACGCGAENETDVKDDSLQKVLDAGKLILGFDTEFPPMGFVDESGESVGFDIDVAREVCNRLGIELVCQGIDWDTKEEYLNDGRIDCIWNGMSVTPNRAEAMTLSEPYMKNELIFVAAGSSDVKELKDLVGKKVGVQTGSTAQDALEASDIFADVIMVESDTQQENVRKLFDGEVDAALLDSVAAYYSIFSSNDKYYILPETLGREEYAIGFRKGDLALRDAVQETISAMKADGTLGEISTKWFGSDITTVI